MTLVDTSAKLLFVKALFHFCIDNTKNAFELMKWLLISLTEKHLNAFLKY